MFSVAEVLQLLALILTPVGAGVSAMFYRIVKQADQRVADKTADIERIEKAHDKERERLIRERDTANDLLLTSLKTAHAAAATTAEAVRKTKTPATAPGKGTEE